MGSKTRMAHSSNIPVSPALAEEFAKARTAGEAVRFIKANIKDEMLHATERSAATDDMKADWDKMTSLMEPKKPSYFVFRMDTKNDLGYQWILVAYVPDGSSVKSRMLYASSRDFFKKQLGYPYFGNEIYGSTVEELSWEGWLEHKDRAKYELPLTEEERFAKEQLIAEPVGPMAVGPTTEGVHGVAFPVLPDAEAALKELAEGSVNLVQLNIDIDKEEVHLQGTDTTDLDGLRKSIPEKAPLYSFYNWEHENEGETVTSTLFIYSCPTGSKVKPRMLYSSVKTTAAAAAEKAGNTIDKKLEITDPEDELKEEDLMFICHPPDVEKKKKFSKPARPGKGGRRLIRRSKPSS